MAISVSILRWWSNYSTSKNHLQFSPTSSINHISSFDCGLVMGNKKTFGNLRGASMIFACLYTMKMDCSYGSKYENVSIVWVSH